MSRTEPLSARDREFQRIAATEAQLKEHGRAFVAAAAALAKAFTAENLDRARILRVPAVEALLALPGPVGLSIAAVVNDLAAACLRAPLRSLPRSEAEEGLYARCRTMLAAASAENAGARAFAAAMMAWHASELEPLPALSSVDHVLRRSWLSFLLETPPAFVRSGEADRFVAYLQQVCDQILDHLRATDGPVDDVTTAFLGSLPFIQSYFNELNLRGLMRSRGAIVEEILRRSGARLDELRTQRLRRRRTRIGFIVLTISDSTETALLVAYMEKLDRERFDVRLFSLPPLAGKLGIACRAAVEAYGQLPEQVPAAVAQLRREDLDIAVFCTNVTAGAHLVTLIAAHRIAPIQVTTGASPVTTGLANMDVMLSGAPHESEDAQEHYTERVVLLPAINRYAFDSMLGGLTPPAPISRAAHAIPADAVLYFSAANFYKILPELSEVWFDILTQVPNSYLMMMPFNPNWSSDYPVLSFNERLRAQAAAAGLDLKRLRLHPPVPTIAHLHRVIEMADVYLDAFPFSGACSIYDALVVKVPIVARSGRVCRSRHSAAILQEAGLGDWSASDTAGYLKRAVELGRDPGRRQADRRRLAAVVEAGLRVTDTADCCAMLMPVFEGLVADRDRRVVALHAIDPDILTDRISHLSRLLAPMLGTFTDRDLIDRVVLPYLRRGGSCRMLDIGACMGAMSRPFLEEGWQAVMFEPDERCHAALSVLVQAYSHQARLEKAVVTSGAVDKVMFHVAVAPGLSGLSGSPYADDLKTVEVRATRLAAFIAANGLADVDFIKIDAEGHDLEILDDLDFRAIGPRLVMVEFGDRFPGQDRSGIAAALTRMRERGYRACVVCARALGDFDQHQWDTSLLAIGVDGFAGVPDGSPLLGNILFFRNDDQDFLPSVVDWLEQYEDRSVRGLLAPS